MENFIPANVDRRTKVYENLVNFQNYLISRNMAQSTISTYLCGVRKYYKKFRKITPQNLQLYKMQLVENYKPQTVNLRIRAFNCYLEYENISDMRMNMVKIQQKTYLDRVISQADYEYLKRRLAEDGKYNYYFVVRFIAATGVRISELLMFRIEDVYKGYKDIRSKGDKIRRIYIPVRLQKDMIEWLDYERRMKGHIFLNQQGSPVTASGIRRQLKAFSYQYCLDEETLYPHSFRHRFAMNFIQYCGDISLLSDLLGHQSIETTRIYLRRSSSEQFRIINKVVDW